MDLRAEDYLIGSGNALKSIEQVNELELLPGDRLLFKSGETFQGMLRIRSSGSPDQVIVVSRYGEGSYPVIDGNGEEAAIRMHNASHLIIEQLKITNWEGSYGIYFTGESTGEMKNLVFRDLDIRRVGYASTTITNPHNVS